MKKSVRMHVYVPVIRRFITEALLFHSTVAAQLGLNATDVSSLRLLGERSFSAGELSAQVGLTGAATTALIDRLEENGFVTRKRSSEDGRRVTVHADANRLRDIDALYAGQGARMAKILAGYSTGDFDVVIDFLTKATGVLTEEAQVIRDLQ